MGSYSVDESVLDLPTILYSYSSALASGYAQQMNPRTQMLYPIQFFFYKIYAGLSSLAWGPVNPFTKSISPLRYTNPFDVTSIPLRAVKSEYGGAAAAKESFSSCM